MERKNRVRNMAKKKNGSSQSRSTVVAEREDKIELRGLVTESLPGTWFKVRVDGGSEVLATLSGKLRQNHIMILPGDNVTVEVSPYDLTRGRISWRG